LATKMLAPTIQFSNNNPRNTHRACSLRYPTVNCPASTSQPKVSVFHNPSSTRAMPRADIQLGHSQHEDWGVIAP